MSLLVPDWAVPVINNNPDTYGRHHRMFPEVILGVDPEYMFEIAYRSEKTKALRATKGLALVYPQHRAKGAGVKVSVREMQIKVAGGCAAGCW